MRMAGLLSQSYSLSGHLGCRWSVGGTIPTIAFATRGHLSPISSYQYRNGVVPSLLGCSI